MEKTLIEHCFDFILKDLDRFSSYNLGQYLPVDLKEKMFSYYTSSISNEPSNSPFPITSYPEDRYRDVQLVNRITCQRVIPLCFAMWSSLDYRYEKVRKLIEEEACDVNESDLEGFCPLHYAAIYGRIDACKLLLIHGADCSRKNNFGKTPSDLAQDVKVQQMIKLRALLFSNVEVKVMEQDLQLKRKQIAEYQRKKLREEFLKQSKLINNVLEKKGYDKKIQSPLSKDRVVSNNSNPNSPQQQNSNVTLSTSPLPQPIFNQLSNNSSLIPSPQQTSSTSTTITIPTTISANSASSTTTATIPIILSSSPSSSSVESTPNILTSSTIDNIDIINNNSNNNNINHLSTSLNDSSSSNNYRAVIAQIDLPQNNTTSTNFSREGSMGTRTRHTMISSTTHHHTFDSTTSPQIQSTASIDSSSSPSSISSISPVSVANNNTNSITATTSINSLPTTFQFVVDSGILLNHLNNNNSLNNSSGSVGNINININININSNNNNNNIPNSNNINDNSPNPNNNNASNGIINNISFSSSNQNNNNNNNNTLIVLSTDSTQNNHNNIHENKE